jgi:hypothetical protein
MCKNEFYQDYYQDLPSVLWQPSGGVVLGWSTSGEGWECRAIPHRRGGCG